MRDAQELARDRQTMASIMQLTSAFEGIASMHVARIKDRVIEAEKFFSRLWPVYTRLRVSKEFNLSYSANRGELIDKELLVVITSENSLSGDIDHRVVSEVSQDFDKSKHDIVVLGRHGASQMVQRNIPYIAAFRLPGEDQPINFDSVVQLVRKYRSTTVYYQSYVTLMTQEVKKIALSSAIQELGEAVEVDEEYISEASYIFEPSIEEVIDYMERSMVYVALSQVTLFSRLAQHASRFKAMTSARSLAQEFHEDMTMQFNKLKRFLKDQRMREIVNGMRRGSS